ncbi:MAG: DNA repair protein RecN [Deltaproteobacteria bacterium]
MIRSISIKNYALIDRLEIDMFQGLNIITGETGAGKSILLGSLELAMGKRADSGVLYNKDESCIVELLYDIKDYGLNNFFNENDLEYSDEITITRTINPSGKSRAFVNDVPINLNVLKDLTEQLILMHRQFDNLELNNPEYQLRIIDNFGDNNSILEKYKDLYSDYQKFKSELQALRSEKERNARELDFMEYQYNELKSAEIDIEEHQANLAQFNNLNNSELIQKTLYSAFNELAEGDLSIIGKLENMMRELNNLDLIEKKFSQSKETLTEILESLNEISADYLHIAETSELDEEKIFALKGRLDFINNLIVKYKVKDIKDLLEIQEDLERKLAKHFNVDNEIAELDKKIGVINKDLINLSEDLSQRRKVSGNEFVRQIEEILKELALPHTKLNVQIEELPDLSATGKDKLIFMFSANKGSEFKPLKEVASGGELSRLALSIESAIAGKMSLPTLIFDEIEAGISGEVARKMGLILKQMSKKHQIISITHSPQIAAKADNHYFVYKNIDKNKTYTSITLLNKEDQIIELAKMLSGEPPTEGAIKNAKELMENK